MRRHLCFAFLAIVAMCSVSMAQMPAMNMPRTVEPVEFSAEQRLTVINYCRLDFDGARLMPQSFDRMRPLLMHKENAKFDTFEVASRFTVPAPSEASSSVVASYRIMGRWDNKAGWRDGSFPEDVRFDVVQREGAALIANIEPGHPRVSARAALAYLRQMLASATTDAERAKIQKGIDALSAASAATTTPSTAPATKP